MASSHKTSIQMSARLNGFFMKDVQMTNLVQLLIVLLMNNIIPRGFLLSENKHHVYNYNRLKLFTSKKQLTTQAQEDNLVSFRLF